MRGVGLLLTSLALAGGTGTAWAQVPGEPVRVPCYSYEEVARQLKGAYQEAPVSLGLQANGNLLQVFSSPATGSWTIVSTTPQGVACVLAAGQHWENVTTPASLGPAA
ncbi:MAG: hypothetical protein ACJ8H8_06345 [Geminicoccaceae bacterium]